MKSNLNSLYVKIAALHDLIGFILQSICDIGIAQRKCWCLSMTIYENCFTWIGCLKTSSISLTLIPNVRGYDGIWGRELWALKGGMLWFTEKLR